MKCNCCKGDVSVTVELTSGENTYHLCPTCYEALRNRWTNDNTPDNGALVLDKASDEVRQLFLDGAKYFVDVMHGTEDERTDVVAYLFNVIASLHNELWRQVNGKYYDYTYHWANLGYGGCPNDSMFKEKSDDA